MSVQAGISNFGGAPIEREELLRISSLTATYGPDGEEIYLHENIGMLFRPLHVTTESRLEHQPHALVDGKMMTWDGRLDNREELIAAIGQSVTLDSTDLEIVACAYDRWNDQSFSKLIGDWALAIWDPKTCALTLARDYIGAKHLWYHLSQRRVVWCTDLAAIADLGKPFTICHAYIASYFTDWPDAHLSPYQEILAVPPGAYVEIREGKVTTRTYWQFEDHLTLRHQKDCEYEEQFRMLLRQAVGRRLRSPFPILAHLSGGLDSTAIVCMADELARNSEVQCACVHTFSFYDPDEPGEDDIHYFPSVERKRGEGHRAKLIATGDTFSLASASRAAEPGFGIREELREAQLGLVKSEEFRVILSGTGGDQMTGQTTDPSAHTGDLLFGLQFKEFWKQIRDWSLSTRRPLIQLLLRTLALLAPSSVRSRVTRPTSLQPWLSESFARRFQIPTRLLPAAPRSWLWPPSVRARYQAFMECSRHLTHMPLAAEETRYPFLDQTFVEFMLSIPANQLLQPNQRRTLMRRALRGILPDEILTRHTKSSTGRCDILTLRKHWAEIDEVTQMPFVSRLGFLDAERFRSALQNFKRGRIPPYDVQLLRGLALEYWLRGAISAGMLLMPDKLAARSIKEGLLGAA